MRHSEENNYPKALAFSTGLLVLFLLICYFFIIGMPFKPESGTGGMVVNFGTSSEGMGTDYMSIDEPSMSENTNSTPPDKAIPNTDPTQDPSAINSNEEVITQDNEDAPSVTTKTDKDTNPTTAPETKETKPTINPNALYSGKTKTANTGKGDGTGSTPGNQGSINGDNLSTNYGEGGSGFGNLTLANRQYVNRPRIDDQGQSSGKIVVEIRVDRTGEVVFARAGARGTTLTDTNLWRKCELAVRGAKFTSSSSAPEVQVGSIVFSFKLN